ncbi:hypothetical protein V5O48_003278 [Marasmius crinis-equi]|uniref:Uncharacterized protein n=1 Tax=Marasmius crinis-equi TaxID=585013 RepID=A0ABR3FTB7_9AGAR
MLIILLHKGVVPGGTSIVLQPAYGVLSYDWTANVLSGTSMLFTMFDNDGRTGGTSDLRIAGATNDMSCINSTTPSSTMAAGPTSTSSGSDSTSSDIPIGAIAGIVIGGLLILALAIMSGLFFLRRRRSHSQDIRSWIDGTEETDFGRHSQRLHSDFNYSSHSTVHLNESTPTLPNPANPFTAPSELDSVAEVHPYTIQESAGPSTTTAQRKATLASVSSHTPSRFIVHTDSEDFPEERSEETVELPPAYAERKPR